MERHCLWNNLIEAHRSRNKVWPTPCYLSHFPNITALKKQVEVSLWRLYVHVSRENKWLIRTERYPARVRKLARTVKLSINRKCFQRPNNTTQNRRHNTLIFIFNVPYFTSEPETPLSLQCYMRALFDYNPSEDTLLPCREIGLPFQKGDVLQIVDQADPNWWQARRVEGDGLGPPGLVPSLELEERRKAFVPPEADFVHKISICGTRISKKKKRKMYQSKSNGEFDGAELLLYEEVARMPPFRRKTLALVGPRGVGRRTLKNRLINSDHERFGTIVPCKNCNL